MVERVEVRQAALHDVGHLARVLGAKGHAEVAAVREARDGGKELEVGEGLGQEEQRGPERPLEVGLLRLGERRVGLEHADGLLHPAWRGGEE